MLPHQFVNFVTKFVCYYDCYVEILIIKFEVSLEDI
jgi:hypothetical protein